MNTAAVVFAIMGVPLVGFLFCWGLLVAFRLLRPRSEAVWQVRPAGVAVPWLQALAPSQEPLPVGVREIRAAQRRRQAEAVRTAYDYQPDYPHGIPPTWQEELWQRRN